MSAFINRQNYAFALYDSTIQSSTFLGLQLKLTFSSAISGLFWVQVAPLLARSNLLITRDIEWANLVLGFEQVTFFSLSHPYFRFEMSLKCYSCSFRAKYL